MFVILKNPRKVPIKQNKTKQNSKTPATTNIATKEKKIIEKHPNRHKKPTATNQPNKQGFFCIFRKIFLQHF